MATWCDLKSLGDSSMISLKIKVKSYQNFSPVCSKCNQNVCTLGYIRKWWIWLKCIRNLSTKAFVFNLSSYSDPFEISWNIFLVGICWTQRRKNQNVIIVYQRHFVGIHYDLFPQCNHNVLMLVHRDCMLITLIL